MVLTQLTGDMRWLSPPYLPTRTRGMSENQDGGLPPEIVSTVRENAYVAIAEWLNGRPPAIPQPDDELFQQMMSACMGETVDSDYVPMVAEEMGFSDRFAAWTTGALPGNVDKTISVAIIGAGVSGLAAAALLARRGVDFTVYEKNDDVGGTWHENRYPGCGVDTPSYLYSLSFDQVTWPEYFATQQDVRRYLVDFVEKEGIRKDIQFKTSVVGAEYDETNKKWEITVESPSGRQTTTANVVISAVGLLNRPKYPTIDGVDRFKGPSFHSAEWPEDVDIRGKRVAVIGTGASAMQIVPAIADQAGEITIFQRSAQWIAPNENYKRVVPPEVQSLLEAVPLYAAWYRMRLAWIFGDKIYPTLLVDPEWPRDHTSINALNDAHRRFFTAYIESELHDRPDLLAQCMPDYPPYGKRMLLDAGWFKALRQPNVKLVSDGVEAVVDHGIVDVQGVEHAADVIVYATGFETLNPLKGIAIEGKAGHRLRDLWGDDNASAYLGMTVPDYPNFFILYGPNTNLGHGGSLIFLSECQIRYILQLIELLLDGRASEIDCGDLAYRRYNDEVDERHASMVWTQQDISNWYRNSRGRIVTNSPWKLLEYWEMTRRPDLADFSIR